MQSVIDKRKGAVIAGDYKSRTQMRGGAMGRGKIGGHSVLETLRQAQ
jgi:hypothetical protein